VYFIRKIKLYKRERERESTHRFFHEGFLGKKKRINEGWKAYFGFENNFKVAEFLFWKKRKVLFDTLVTLVILYGYEV
jgi:hypothetical protein